jgi:hypothetical protein
MGAMLVSLEIAVDPERVGVDHRDGVDADIDVVAELRQQVGHVAVDRRDDARALEIDLRPKRGKKRGKEALLEIAYARHGTTSCVLILFALKGGDSPSANTGTALTSRGVHRSLRCLERDDFSSNRHRALPYAGA